LKRRFVCKRIKKERFKNKKKLEISK